MQGRNYVVYDVFTEQRLSGNPLAVVLDGEGLDEAAMQRIAREFNLSETTFVSPPQKDAHKARVRIFTPAYEMPFAGHPTVGTAIA
nr:PhzF family phenazine biosynthesis protein [Pseudaminobacter sp.]